MHRIYFRDIKLITDVKDLRRDDYGYSPDLKSAGTEKLLCEGACLLREGARRPSLLRLQRRRQQNREFRCPM